MVRKLGWVLLPSHRKTNRSPYTDAMPRRWSDHRASSFLESALVFTFFAHGLAMLSMAILLLPAMPGGTANKPIYRIEFVAHHPWLWRLGWFPWQLTALSDLVLGIALFCTPWVPKLRAIAAVLLTALAMIPDQSGQFLWTWRGPSLARAALTLHRPELYLLFEQRIFHQISGIATIGYLAGAIAWTSCFAASETWTRRLTWLSIATWTIFAAATAMLFLPLALQQKPSLALIVAAGNAIAFILLMLWTIGAGDVVLLRTRPTTQWGRYAPWRYPSSTAWARALDWVANSRFLRLLGEYLPALVMDSDISDVVYVNYLLPASMLSPLATPPLKLQRLGRDGSLAMFTFLTYRHGHFGPRCFGPLRRLWPSPIQSNWRIYVEGPDGDKRGVQFVTTAITSLPTH